ncbi:hypothetical protein [Lapidilactobacillus dextrinicus]|uniref:hypothetical protein n=1 Tax=Lapidilactobacillus dextrinicus TaxID=51664 RepID=UPI0022E50DD6|nr:hypothetical protein [Lapidilactobacillus dextrinicus]
MASELTIAIPDTATNEITAMFIASAQKAFNALVQAQSYPPYMNQGQACDYLHVSVKTFKKLNIPVVSLDGVTRYSRTTLDQYCKDNEI